MYITYFLSAQVKFFIKTKGRNIALISVSCPGKKRWRKVPPPPWPDACRVYLCLGDCWLWIMIHQRRPTPRGGSRLLQGFVSGRRSIQGFIPVRKGPFKASFLWAKVHPGLYFCEEKIHPRLHSCEERSIKRFIPVRKGPFKASFLWAKVHPGLHSCEERFIQDFIPVGRRSIQQ